MVRVHWLLLGLVVHVAGVVACYSTGETLLCEGKAVAEVGGRATHARAAVGCSGGVVGGVLLP